MTTQDPRFLIDGEPPILASLCTGILGLDRGVQAVFGGELSWVADPDPHASKVIEARLPNVRNFGDFRGGNIAGPVDVLSAGFPCQDISLAGKGAGLGGSRSALWFDVLDVIKGLMPSWVAIENVPALKTRGLDVVLAGLTEAGYGGLWCFYRSGYYGKNPQNFAHVGGCHQRKRLFILAERGRSGFTEHKPAAEPTIVETLPTASMSTGPGRSGREGGANLQTAVSELLPTPTATDSRGSRNATSGRKPGSNHHAGTTLNDVWYADTWGKYAPAIQRWTETFGTPPPPPTIDDNGPKLNPALPEWMMGLPAGWVTDLDIPRTQQLKLIGNSAQSQVAEAAFRSMKGAL